MSEETKIKLLRIEASNCSVISEAELTDDSDHPNKLTFTGTLLLVDVPSDRAPHGSDGHKILVPRSVAQAKLGTLIGMGVNYSPTLDSHAPRHKVGVVTFAWLEGNKVKVKGIIWKKDFPEVVDDIKGQPLGMSMELADILIRDKNEPVWYLTDFFFTGATVLWPTSAAYYRTSLAASAWDVQKGDPMADKTVTKKPADAAHVTADRLVRKVTAGVTAELTAGLQELRENLQASASEQTEILREIARGMRPSVAASADDEDGVDALLTLLAAKKSDDEDDEDDDDSDVEGSGKAVRAKKSDDEDLDAKKSDDEDLDAKKSDEDDEDLDAKKSDEDDEDLDAEDANPIPGQLNKTAKNKGSKTTVTARGGFTPKGVSRVMAPGKGMKMSKTVNAMAAAAAVHIRTLEAQLDRERKQNRKQVNRLNNKVEMIEAQLELSARRTERRSISAAASALLERAGADAREIYANAQQGRVMTVRQVDQIFERAGVKLDPTTRIQIKNEFIQAGIMEQGIVNRQQ